MLGHGNNIVMLCLASHATCIQRIGVYIWTTNTKDIFSRQGTYLFLDQIDFSRGLILVFFSCSAETFQDILKQCFVSAKIAGFD